MNRDRVVALSLLVPLALGLAFSYARLIAAPSHVPQAYDYARARDAIVAAGYDRSRDALAVLPPWSLRAYEKIGDLDPISGDALGSRPLHRHRRLFVLVEPDPSSEHEELHARLGPPASREEFGAVAVERWDLPGPYATYDFTARLQDAQARIVTRGDPVVCDARLANGWACRSRPEWQRLSRLWLLVSENADYAVWAHPPKPGERLEAAWNDVAIGSAIVLRAGHTRDGADRAKTPVRVRVFVDDVEVGVAVREPVFDFRTDVFDTSHLAGRRARVAISVEADDDAVQQFAWDAYVVGGAR